MATGSLNFVLNYNQLLSTLREILIKVLSVLPAKVFKLLKILGTRIFECKLHCHAYHMY